MMYNKPMKDATTTIQKLKEEMKQFTQERNWDRYQDMRNLAISITLKAGEVLKECQWMSEKELADAEASMEAREGFAKNLMDVFTYILIAANKFDLDLSEIFDKRLAEMIKKYPAETFDPKKELSWEEDNKEYYKIKKSKNA